MKTGTKVDEVITPEMAQKYLDNNPKNRNVSTKRVEQYAEEMKKGLWNYTHEGIAIDQYGRLLDGQHRLMAIVLSGVAQKMQVTKGLDSEVIHYINRGKNRSIADDLHINGYKYGPVLGSGLPAYMRMRESKSSLVDTRGLHGKNSISSIEVENELKSDVDFYTDIAKLSGEYYLLNKYRFFTKTEYFAWICFLVKEKNHLLEKVTEFFNDLNNFSGSSTIIMNDLRNRLLTEAKSRKKYLQTEKQKMLIKCWNEWVKGNDIKRLDIRDNQKLDLI